MHYSQDGGKHSCALQMMLTSEKASSIARGDSPRQTGQRVSSARSSRLTSIILLQGNEHRFRYRPVGMVTGREGSASAGCISMR